MTTESGWLPIETAPKDGTSFLSYNHPGYNCFQVVAWDLKYGWLIFNNGENGDFFIEAILPPTHWMPLPAPPKDIATHPEGRSEATA